MRHGIKDKSGCLNGLIVSEEKNRRELAAKDP